MHDDRADCVQRLVETLSGFLSRDEEKVAVEREEKFVADFMSNPMGYTKKVLDRLNGNKTNRRRRR